jgi:hypothetical protein
MHPIADETQKARTELKYRHPPKAQNITHIPHIPPSENSGYGNSGKVGNVGKDLAASTCKKVNSSDVDAGGTH